MTVRTTVSKIAFAAPDLHRRDDLAAMLERGRVGAFNASARLP